MSEREELRSAVRCLMERRTLLAERPEDRDMLSLVRRHAVPLRRWFNQQPRYDLTIEADWARLSKVAGDDTPRTGFSLGGGRPFDRRRYVWLCLALASIDRMEDRRFRLGALAEEIEAFAHQEGVRAPNLDQQGDRAAVGDVFRFLESEGVVQLTDGSLQSFVDDPNGDALYEVDRTLAVRLLSARRPPSACATADEMTAEVYPPTRDGANARIRNRLWRRILEEPVVYYDTLTHEERAYLDGQWRTFQRDLADMCGLVFEMRVEGVAAIEPAMQSAAFPSSTAGSEAMALALVHRLLAQADSEAEGEPVSLSRVRLCLEPLMAHPRLRREYRAEGGVERLLERVLEALDTARLIARTADAVVPLPALRRYIFTMPSATGRQHDGGDDDGAAEDLA